MEILYKIKWNHRGNPSNNGESPLHSNKVKLIRWKNHRNIKFPTFKHEVVECIYGDLRDRYIERITDDYQIIGNYKILI